MNIKVFSCWNFGENDQGSSVEIVQEIGQIQRDYLAQFHYLSEHFEVDKLASFFGKNEARIYLKNHKYFYHIIWQKI